ncbi:MAG: hypothetical protein GF401_13530 [Chitinivibrionales bacterium]|nr:hypothetical protein [Chitinivibrionales bacterium]
MKNRIICFLALSIFSSVGLANTTRDEGGFNVKIFSQGDNVHLCWAYATLSVLHHYQKHFSIDQLVDYATCGFYDEYGCLCSKCCTEHPGCVNCRNAVSGILQEKGQIGSYCIGQADFDNHIKTSIDLKRPLIAHYTIISNGVGHDVVISKYCKITYSDNSEVKTIEYMDPWLGYMSSPVNYDYFCGAQNDEYDYDETLVLENSPGTSFTTDAVDWDAIKWYFELEEEETPGGGYLRDQPVASCEPYVGDQGCTHGCATNVHLTGTQLWFSNVPHTKFEYPVSFPKKGIYKINLTLRGSVCDRDGGSTTNSCEIPIGDVPMTLEEVNSIADLTLNGSGSNFIKRDDVIISGSELDRAQYIDQPFPQEDEEVACRAFTLEDIPIEQFPKRKPGDITISFEAWIAQAGVENIVITLTENNSNGTVGLSLHKIETQFYRNFIYGCTNRNASNHNRYADIDDGSCIFPPPPPPPPPPPTVYDKTFTFQGAESHFTQTCYGCFSVEKDCDIVKYRIIWGDGTPDETGSGRSNYVSQSFTHTYSKFGTFHPYVEITRLHYKCWPLPEEKKKETKSLATIINRPDISPVINLLLLD